MPTEGSEFYLYGEPDGSQIVYTDIQLGKLAKSFVISAQGGAPAEMYRERNSQLDANWSRDGKHLAGLSADSKTLVVYDFGTQKWSDWITGLGSVGTPAWSRDSKYIYFDPSGDHPGYRRVKLGETHSEFLVDLKDMHRSWWSGITPDNSPILSRDISTDEIYALDVELP